MIDGTLQQRLDAICRRLRRAALLQAAVTGCVAAASAYLVLYVGRLFLPLPAYVLWWLSTLSGLVTLFVRWDRGPSRLDAAFFVDSKLKLQERLTAAVEFSSIDLTQSVLVQRLQADAAQLAPTIEPRHLVPYRLPRKALLLPPLLLLIWGLHTTLPHDLMHRGAALDPNVEAIQQQVEELQLLPELFLERAAEQGRADLIRHSELLRDLAERLARGELTIDQLHRELARLEEQMGAALDPFSSGVTLPDDTGAPPRESLSASPDTPSAERRPGGDETAEPDNAEDTIPSEASPEHDVGDGHDGPEENRDAGRDGSDREQSGQGRPTDDFQWEGADELPPPGSLEAPDGGEEDAPNDRAGTGDASEAMDDGDRLDRPETDGSLERLTGILQSEHSTLERREELTTPQGDFTPAFPSELGEVLIVAGPEVTVLHEEVPPHLRALVRRYFEGMANGDSF